MNNTYKLILDSYAKRLITTNSRTRTIYYSKNDKYIIDISRFLNMFTDDEINKFFSSGEGKLKFNNGSMSSYDAYALFDRYNNGEMNKFELLDEYYNISDNDLSLLSNKDNYRKIYEKYEDIKKKELKNIYKINSENDSIVKQMGKDDLYIGYPYIQGRFNKDKVVRAPLLLHKVSVEEVGDNIIVRNEGIKILNPVFIMSYLVENEITYTDALDFEILEDDYMPVVDKIFNNIGIKYTNVMGEKIEKMRVLTKGEFKTLFNYEDNKFEIVNHSALGVFPLSDKKIYDDVKDLRDSEKVNVMLNSFYDKNSDVLVFDDKDEDIDESKLKYVTVLDYSQKKTLQNALEKNCIIQGPPGTGKSQVIVNIAANLLLNRSNTLFCSEKRTATDVIYNRLGRLNSFALLLHDHISEKNYFYDSIVRAVNSTKDNIDKYKKKTFSFNGDYKIKAFFDNSKKYNSIVNGDYRGLSFKEVVLNNGKSLECEDKFVELIKLVDNKNDLEKFIYEYDSSSKYQNGLKWKKELLKEYYSKYGINIGDSRLININNIYDKVNKENNNYLKNLMVDKFINLKEEKKNLFKAFLGKNVSLNDSCIDFLDLNKHNFEVFKNEVYSNDVDKLLFDLKFVDGMSNDHIISNYLICVGKTMYKEIDFDFLDNYTSSYSSLMDEAFKCMDSKIEESIEFIARSCSADIKEKLSNPMYNEKLQRLLGEINKKRKPPVKVIIDRYFDILQILFPIWIMTPDVVSAVIPLKENIFSKVIFDEASQLFIERTIPSIARGTSIVICGDSKQLRPTLFFESRYDETEEDVLVDVEQESALTENSLLDYATTSNKYVSSMLRYHYRCYYKELINFSNYAFYNGDLVFASNIKGKETMPIETIDVDGKWDGEKNLVEAERVVELVKNLLFNRKENETIGIVTLNVNQRDLILDLLEEECKKDKEFASLYRSERIRKDEKDNEDESIFVKNLENVQGDERDIIIFSISYSKNEKGNIGSSLGELQRQYGENRLNVAVSRAKKKIYIIKSFKGEELSINDSNKGPMYFKQYLCYADALNNGDNEHSKAILNSLNGNEEGVKVVSNNSWFEEDIYNDLINILDSNKYEIRKNIEIGSFVLNVAIYDKVTNDCLLAIDCSGIDNYDKDSEVSDDIYKHYYLKNRGYNVYRVWISSWMNNKENIINDISTNLNNIN